jgi:TrmH family RNA methyltransferase
METLGKNNPRVTALRKWMRSPRHRKASGNTVLEGPKACADALSSGADLKWVLCSNAQTQAYADLLEKLEGVGIEVFEADEGLVQSLSDAQTTQGILAVVALPPVREAEDLLDFGQDLLGLVGVQDPGNLGAIVRVAAAAGLGGVLVGPHCADPFSPKALRGSTGWGLRVPIGELPQPADAFCGYAAKQGYTVAAAVPRSGAPPTEADLSGPCLFLLGGEGAGLSEDWIAAASEHLTIPMQPNVESLNVTVSAALLAYEARRQKGR